ncbi:MAG TPA: DUF4124 domain-containing protein [Rudaea sp.]|nr:DUF4124 domain-containing protein [Rudaea sp.]
MPRSCSIANDPPHGRALTVLLALVAATGAAAAWWYFAPESLPGALRGALPVSPKAVPVLYKWHDAKGGLHVTDTPPTDRPYEAVRYDPNVNVVPSVVPPDAAH